jgi:hypothetical protein
LTTCFADVGVFMSLWLITPLRMSGFGVDLQVHDAPVLDDGRAAARELKRVVVCGDVDYRRGAGAEGADEAGAVPTQSVFVANAVSWSATVTCTRRLGMPGVLAHEPLAGSPNSRALLRDFLRTPWRKFSS